MKQVVIIGAGYAGRNIALRLKEHAQVTVVEEKTVLCAKEKFFPWLAKKASDKDLLLHPEKFFALQGVPFVPAKVEKIYPLKKEIGLENKERLSYELLIIASGSLSAPRHNCAGDGKRGVFYFSEIEPKQMLETFHEATYVIVEAHTFMGIITAVLLRRHFPQKEVKLFIQEAYVRELFRRHFPDEQHEVYGEEEIVECIGEGMIKAIRLNTGKVYAADLLFLDTGLVPNTKLFESFGFFTFEQNAFAVDSSLKTSLEDICALGDAANSTLRADRTLFRTAAYIDRQIERLAPYITDTPAGSGEPLSTAPNEDEAIQGIKTQILAP